MGTKTAIGVDDRRNLPCFIRYASYFGIHILADTVTNICVPERTNEVLNTHPPMPFSRGIQKMTKSQTRMAAKNEAIEILQQLYRKLMDEVKAGDTFQYGTINGVALARLEIELEM